MKQIVKEYEQMLEEMSKSDREYFIEDDIFSRHPMLDSRVIFKYHVPFLTILLPVIYGIIAVLTVVFFLLSKETLSKIKFFILTIAFIMLTIERLSILNITTSWIFTGILLMLISIEYLKHRNNKQFAD